MSKGSEQKRAQARRKQFGPDRGADNSRRAFFDRIRSAVLAVVQAPDDLSQAMQQSAQRPLAAMTVLGTAFVVDKSGIAVTAKHVVQPWMDAFEAYNAGKTAAPPLPKVALVTSVVQQGQEITWGFVVGAISRIQSSMSHDIAAFRFSFPPDHALTVLEPSPQMCEDGDEVVICGYPFGLDLHEDQLGGMVLLPSFSQGIVSAALPFPRARKETRTVFQLDLMVNGGNSGGPVVALESGKVVGVVINALTQVQKNPGPPDFTPGGPDVELEVPTGIGRGIYIHMAEPAILDLRKS